MNIEQAFDHLFNNEGGYSNNPRDPGGETMWGITARVARANGYLGPMREMPRETARFLYRRLYWDAVQADQLPGLLRFQVFDAGVNSGPGRAATWLQRAVGVTADGQIGARTVAAARAAVPWRTATNLLGQRLRFMTGQDTWDEFGEGWANRIADNLLALSADSEV